MVSIDLSGKVAVITGATGKLGPAIALKLAEAGADVAITYLNNTNAANQLVEEVKRLGRLAMAVKVDVTHELDIVSLRDTVESQLGAVSIIVNNAIIQYAWKSVLDQPLADYESQFKSCVIQNVVMAKVFAPGMIKAKWGRIIALNTECSMQGFSNQSAYISGKRGQDGIVRVLARELGMHGITVNQVAPGWTVTKRQPEVQVPQWYIDNIPLKKVGTDMDVANLVTFLASDLAGFITGAYIAVSGGTVMPAI
jgi:3-oxoacyl-[acyl-carrier protein] reductase